MSGTPKQHKYKKSTIISENSDKPKSDKAKHYVKNADFFAALVERKEQIATAEAAGNPKPRLSEYLGLCILQIATNLSSKSNFVNYPYRQEMISDAVLNCIQYVDNFDPKKSKNPFSYFTQISYYAMIGRISNEKKQQYVKFRSTINHQTGVIEDDDNMDTNTMAVDSPDNNYMQDFVDTYEQKNSLGIYKKPRASSRGKTNLEKAMKDNEDSSNN